MLNNSKVNRYILTHNTSISDSLSDRLRDMGLGRVNLQRERRVFAHFAQFCVAFFARCGAKSAWICTKSIKNPLVHAECQHTPLYLRNLVAYSQVVQINRV